MLDFAEISECFSVPAYHQVQSEEGPYDAQCGFNIIAREKPDSQGNYGYWIWCGKPDKDGSMIPRPFKTEAYANGFANGIKGVGKILMSRWYCFDVKNLNDLPDYVTDPTNPMFN